MDAIEAPDAGQGREVLDLPAQDFVEVAGDDLGGRRHVSLGVRASLVQIAPEFAGGTGDRRQQRCEHQDSELGLNGPAHNPQVALRSRAISI